MNDLYAMTVVQRELADRRRHAAIRRSAAIARRARREEDRRDRPSLWARVDAWLSGATAPTTEESAPC